MIEKTTIVLGGGGVWGVAWMTGLAKGLADCGLNLRLAEAFIGTSAGSVVSTQLAMGMDIDELYARQVEASRQPNEPVPSMDGLAKLGELLMQPTQDNIETAKQIGALSLAAETIPYKERRAAIVERLGLPSHTWPAKTLKITAVDAETGELETFDASSDVDIIDAVAASCAVPCIWPVTPILDRYYIDGGVWRTPDNAQLAAGADQAIIISPFGASAPTQPILRADINDLEKAGTRVHVISPDESSQETTGENPLDPAVRKPAAQAGKKQGETCSEDVKRFLNAEKLID